MAVWSVFVLGGTVQAQAQDDPWFGRDKLKHFGASAVIAAGGSTLGAVMFDSDKAPVAFGAAVSLGAGGLKEWSDSRGDGSASWRDVAWNVVGTSVGAGIAYLIWRSRSGVPDASGAAVLGRPTVTRRPPPWFAGASRAGPWVHPSIVNSRGSH
jgi:uncharacterized protein YfiM (DUF2279 family)